MRDHRNTATLQAVVGSERDRYSVRQVASAQRELELRAAGEQALFERKVRLSANACVIIGTFCVVWPAVILFVLGGDLGHSTSSVDPREPAFLRHFDAFFVATGLLEALCGALLLAGGVGIRARRAFGPVLISTALVMAAGYVTVFTVASLPMVPRTSGSLSGLFLGFLVGTGALLLSLLWLPFRFFASPRLRDLCRRATAV